MSKDQFITVQCQLQQRLAAKHSVCNSAVVHDGAVRPQCIIGITDDNIAHVVPPDTCAVSCDIGRLVCVAASD